MATVRMSDNLISSIAHKAEAAAYASIPRPPKADFNIKNWADKFYELYMNLPTVRKYVELSQQPGGLGCAMMAEQETLTSLKVGELGPTKYLSATFNSPKKMPSFLSTYSGAKVVLHEVDITPAIKAHVQEIDEARDAQAQYLEQIRAFTYEITGACKQFTTLNQALKKIPHLDKLVPDHYMEKVRKKAAPRVKKTPVEVEFDTHGAAAKIAQARLMGKI